MSIEVALIDFPRLQEQITTRLLAEHKVNVQRLDHREAATRLDMFNLALFFWPDASHEAGERLKAIRASDPTGKVPVVLVTSEVGRRNAESVMGPKGATDILVTPLQPQIVSRKLAQLLGLSKEAPTEAKQSLNVDYINPFVEATVDTLKQMAEMESERTGLSLRTDAATKGYISGTMGLSGAAEGFVAITFGDALARKIVCRMLQMPIGDETEEDIRDGVGELMNVVAGQAKSQLANTEHAFMLSLPNVIVGGPHTVGQLRGVPVIVVEFSTEGDTFEVMVSLIPHAKRG